jgi:hypothetical protein
MRHTHSLSVRASLAAALALTAAAASGQVITGGTGFITVSVAGIGGAGGLTGDARLPVTGAGARFDPTNNHVSISANGRRGIVRRIELDVPNAHAGQRIELGPGSGASIRITLDGQQPLGADSSRGFIQFESLTAARGVGRYEGTFQNGQSPIVVRGNFQVNFTPSVGNAPGGANPGPGPRPGPVTQSVGDAGHR